MTGRELCKILEESNALDYEVMMNHNLELVPVKNVLTVHNFPIANEISRTITILDT